MKKIDWKRIVAFVILISACFLMAFGVSLSYLYQVPMEEAPLWWVGEHFTGTIEVISPEALTVMDENNNKMLFEITPYTKKSLKNSLGFQPGVVVIVTYKDAGERKIAKALRETIGSPGILTPSALAPQPSASSEPTVPQAETAPAPEETPAASPETSTP